MELRQLVYAIAVGRHENFTRAAHSLRIAQPALSVQIRNLERELGIALFERTTRRVRVTPAGAAFLERAEQILRDADAAALEMTRYAGTTRGTVHVGAWFTVNPSLAGLLAGFLEAHPGVSIKVREENSDVMLELLRFGDLDAAFLTMCDGLDFRNVEHVVYLEEPLVLEVSPDSALARLPSVTISEIADEPLILQRPGSAIRRLVEQAFRTAHQVPRVTVETSQTAAVRDLVATGLGIAMLPQSLAELPGPPIRIIPITPAPVRVSAVAWRRGGQLPATKAFILHVRTALG